MRPRSPGLRAGPGPRPCAARFASDLKARGYRVAGLVQTSHRCIDRAKDCPPCWFIPARNCNCFRISGLCGGLQAGCRPASRCRGQGRKRHRSGRRPRDRQPVRAAGMRGQGPFLSDRARLERGNPGRHRRAQPPLCGLDQVRRRHERETRLRPQDTDAWWSSVSLRNAGLTRPDHHTVCEVFK